MPDAEADRESTSKPFFERRLFKAAVAVVGLLGAVWALLGAPKPWDVAKDITAAAPLPLKNTEIVLDASAHMGEPFGRVTKYDIAATAVAQWAVSSEEVGLALRGAGGSCDDDGEALIDFGKGNSDDVRKAAFEKEPAGRSNFVAAVRTAVTEFSDARFKRPGAENQVMVFVGGKDECAPFRARKSGTNWNSRTSRPSSGSSPSRSRRGLRSVSKRWSASCSRSPGSRSARRTR